MTDHQNLAAALAAFQAELPAVKKTKTAKVEGKDGKRGYEYSYADLADVSQTVLPLLGKHGLSFSSKPTLDERGQFVLAYVLRHACGDSDAGTYPLPTGRPQDVGSAISYARRYALCSVTGLAAEDDDDGAAAPDVPDVRAQRREQLEAEQAEEYARLMGLVEQAGDEAAIGEHGQAVTEALAAKRITRMQRDRLARRASERVAEFRKEAG